MDFAVAPGAWPTTADRDSRQPSLKQSPVPRSLSLNVIVIPASGRVRLRFHMHFPFALSHFPLPPLYTIFLSFVLP